MMPYARAIKLQIQLAEQFLSEAFAVKRTDIYAQLGDIHLICGLIYCYRHELSSGLPKAVRTHQ